MLKLWNRQHKFLSVLIWLVIAIVIFIAVEAVVAETQHHKLVSSIDALQTKLAQSGIASKKSVGCGEAYTEFGSNETICSVGLDSIVPASTVEVAHKRLTDYIDAITDAKRFRLISAIPNSIIDKDKLSFGYVGYININTSKSCTVSYDYSKEKYNLRLNFSCDDNSWFRDNF